MRAADLLSLCLAELRTHRQRSLLSMLGVAIGIAAVVVLTSIGEGTRRFVLAQFTQFGTNLIAINPGKTETIGLPGVLGGTTHKLSLSDAEALGRLPLAQHVVPVAVGTARVSHAGLGRSVYVYGTTPEAPAAWRFGVRQGSFLPPGDARRGAAVVVLGPTLEQELFGEASALGAFVRVAGWRLRVVGVMEPKGRLLGFDIDDAAYVPVATALEMFDLEELHEIDVTFAHAGLEAQLVADMKRVLTARHGGREDFTVTTQSSMLAVFDDVLGVLTLAVGGLGGISLVVGALGILTMMWIAVGERTGEIGLLVALGATRAQVRQLFLVEAAALAGVGGAAGLAGGLALVLLLGGLLPGLPLQPSLDYAAAALLVCLATGLIAGAGPARRAARLDPVEALREE